MRNSLQPNPSNASENVFTPDWNSHNGTGVDVPEEHAAPNSFADYYQSAKDGERERRAAK